MKRFAFVAFIGLACSLILVASAFADNNKFEIPSVSGSTEQNSIPVYIAPYHYIGGGILFGTSQKGEWERAAVIKLELAKIAKVKFVDSPSDAKIIVKTREKSVELDIKTTNIDIYYRMKAVTS